ncbi:kinase interacting family protein [Striga asiatica]|uniref:Kinase interacting family protein n=1 Tax=Striga asiatica TaxID=4170 RepID=A0A5A7PPD7_STRAF|nr:kinase interacting family protein [Striga asiatica]
MLQRAASNAYSWWWASHIRTKQSKWLEQCLQDMEDKVQSMLKLIEEDGDSFAKRAEMYYKRRPELINSVEESYKAFRALADRYDLLSKELQNANHTIATVFPEQVQLSLSEPDDLSPGPTTPPNGPLPCPNIPQAPKKDLKTIITKASKQLRAQKPQKPDPKSGLTKEEALDEMKRIQKDILALQTVKEFVKSSYESGLSKYWGIENQIMELQQKVSRLQDEFDMDTVIEDDEARTLMAEAALRSCRETLTMLEEKQEKATREAKEEYKRIESACRRLQSLRERYCPAQNENNDDSNRLLVNSTGDEVDELMRESGGIEIEGSMELGNLTVGQLAEKIDQLVNRVIGLETAVSSQTVLVNTLRAETDDLSAQISGLEKEEEVVHDLGHRVKGVEGKLSKVQDLNKSVETQGTNIETNFAVARSNLHCLSQNLKDNPATSPEEDLPPVTQVVEDVKEIDQPPVVERGMLSDEKRRKEMTTAEEQRHSYVEKTEENTEEEDEDMNWQEMLLSGMEDREKILLKEYTTILRNYKDVKRKLIDLEKKEKDSQFDSVLQIRELRDAVQRKDDEIKTLRHRLLSQQESRPETRDDVPCASPGPDDDSEIKLVLLHRPLSLSKAEEKLRTDIDAILDENLDFWLRFSTEFHQIQKFRTEVNDLENEVIKVREKRKADGSFPRQAKSDARPVYKHLLEIQRELEVWLEHSESLKDELKRRFESLCVIQEEITEALREGVEEEEIRFSSHQAAKFQGEVLNMKQENNKVREELRTGLDHVHELRLRIEKMLRKLNQEFEISSEQGEGVNRPRVPLSSFLFGTKLKKQKHSIFSCMHPGKRYQVMRAAIHLSSPNH